MKKIFLFLLLLLNAFFFSSCEDESLSPLPVKVEGSFVRLDIQKRQLDFNNLETTYIGGPMTVTSGDVVKFEMFVNRIDPNNVVTTDYVPFRTITTFPNDFRVTPSDLANALGLEVSELQDGDFYRFIGFAYDSNGKKTSYLDLSRQVQVAYAMKQAFRFNTELTDTPIDTNNPDLTQYNNYQ